MCGKSGEEVGPLSGVKKAHRKGTAEAIASSLKPNSPAVSHAPRGTVMLLSLGSRCPGLAGPGAVLALSWLLIHILPTLLECPSPSQKRWEGAEMISCL